jgi:DNA-binding response OmpR family regulator
MGSRLDHCRVLVVEDDSLVGFDVRSLLREAGCEVVGPFPSKNSALRAISEQHIDAAVVDVNLGDSFSFSVADALTWAKVPFLWLTGYSPDVLPDRYRSHLLIDKPYTPASLIGALETVLARADLPEPRAEGPRL